MNGKPSSPVLRGLGASNSARLLEPWDYFRSPVTGGTQDNTPLKYLQMDAPRPKYRVHREYRVQYGTPVQVVAGDKVSVGRDDVEYPGWKWCTASNGCEGWIPAELLAQEGGEAIVLQEYSSQELAVEPGDEVEVEDERRGWLRVRNARGQLGWIPASHVCL